MTEPTQNRRRELSDAVKASWHDFLDHHEELRPELYRQSQGLAVPCRVEPVDRSRAASARSTGELAEAVAESRPQVDPEAARTLLALLSPQERAAVVLKDVFDFTLGEIAETLSTTAGAVKAALHRGRTKLSEFKPADAAETRAPTPTVLNAFCDAFNARDLERMTALLLDNATVDIVGLVTEYGPEAARDADTGSFHGMMFGDLSGDDPRGGVEHDLRAGVLSSAPRAEIRDYRGEPIVLFWYSHADGEAVRAVARVQCEGDRVGRLRNYFFTPGVLAEVCRELAVPYRINGHRYWYRRRS